MSHFQGSPEDAVQSTAKMTEMMKAQMDKSRKDTAGELGLTAEEVSRRRQEANRPREYVSGTTQKKFDVKSSARAQQIMQQGIDKTQREKRTGDFKKNMKLMRKFQFGMGLFIVCFAFVVGREILLPQYAAVQERNRVLQIRSERARARLEQLARERGLADGEALVVHGSVARVTRDGEDNKDRRIQ
ncbi:hypothetical protein STCU_01234 [Strigomonas culicis]|uniref:Uncharacterized protein n=1 Tax=Strigomonas culicis TaxID=28005 RepID=S9UW75_9TRYP|nr:hypothetical protein STCU_01234 [Strigomonas culicis]|eukprot:EPY35132.1 hypothetical protein STCU_01234 [Strigomonas culicis]